MSSEYQSMKRDLLLTIFDIENKNFGRAQCNRIDINTLDYYSYFEGLYQENPRIFAQAISDLYDVSTFDCHELGIDINSKNCTYLGNIKAHVLRLRLYFGIDSSKIPELLKKLYIYSIELLNSDDCFVRRDGSKRYFECLAILESLSVKSKTDRKQLYYSEKIPKQLCLNDFMSFYEVNDVYSAGIYDSCYRYGYVKEYPICIKKALLASNIYDKLVTVEGWKIYFSRYSAKHIHNDIDILKLVGFEKIPDLINVIIDDIEFKVFSSKKEKSSYSNKIIERFKHQIETYVHNEDIYVIDEFLCKNIKYYKK
jgi:hypothetical protein